MGKPDALLGRHIPNAASLRVANADSLSEALGVSGAEIVSPRDFRMTDRGGPFGVRTGFDEDSVMGRAGETYSA